MAKRTPDAVRLTVVESTLVHGGLSLRAFDAEEERYSARELRRRLADAGYKPGDVVVITCQPRLASYADLCGVVEDEQDPNCVETVRGRR